MAFIPVPNAAKIVITTKIGTRLMSNVLHTAAATPAPIDQASLAAVAGIVRTWWDADLSGELSTGIDLVQVQATALDTNTSPQATVAGSSHGTLASAPLPLEVCACVSLYSVARGRSFRGRIYQPGITIGQMSTGGLFDASVKTNLETSYNNLLGLMEAANFELVVVSTHTAHAPRVSGIFSEVTSILMRTLVPRAQRRRENDH